jgi:hypothetical protein
MAEEEKAQGAEPEQPADAPEAQEKPRIIVDDDWKAQAQAEKERLAEKADEPDSVAGTEAEAEARPRELPEAGFPTLVNSLVAQTFYALGGVEDPRTHRRYVDLDLAKHHIDTLAVLEDKTRGNLTDEEQRLLDQALYETRIQYVNIAQRVSPQM